MRRLFILLILGPCFSQSATKLDEAQVSKARFPLISGINGQVTAQGRDQKVRSARLNEILKERAILQTGNKSQVRIELDEKNGIILLENSTLEIPVIGFEFGEVVDVVLKSGRVRIQSNDANERNYSTPVTKDIYREADLLLQYDPSRAQTAMTVFSGQVSFRGLENEVSLVLASGENAIFTGVLENNEPAYDILLKGRKVARGQLSEKVTAIIKKDLEVMNQETLLKKPVRPKTLAKPLLKPGQICDEPPAKLDECVWRCRGPVAGQKLKKCDVSKAEISCIRQRCNANGQWGDDFVLPAGQSRCELRPVVGPCDY